MQDVQRADDGDTLATDADIESHHATTSDLTNPGDAAHPADKDGFTCPVCQKHFQSNHIKRHMRIHSGERPYACGICQYRFSQPANLTRHMSVVHAGERRYTCDVCERTFTSSSNMKVRRCNKNFLKTLGHVTDTV